MLQPLPLKPLARSWHFIERDPVLAGHDRDTTEGAAGARNPTRHGLRANATAFETRGGLHAHITFIGNTDIADSLKRSSVFGDLIEVGPITHPQDLARKYLGKERTPQAGYRRQHVLGGRVRGSHCLDGGGDRVRLSRDLERDAIAAGYVEPWQHTNARRSLSEKPIGCAACLLRRHLAQRANLPSYPS
jgi:hypothetical protein